MVCGIFVIMLNMILLIEIVNNSCELVDFKRIEYISKVIEKILYNIEF